MASSRRNFQGSLTTGASYAAVPLDWSPSETGGINWFRSTHGGPLGGSVYNSEATNNALVTIVATDRSANGKTPDDPDPTNWPAVLAEFGLVAGAEKLFEFDVTHHLFYAFIAKNDTGACAIEVNGSHRPQT